MLLTCCSSVLKSLWHSTPSFWLHGGKRDVGEGQLTTSHDVTTEGFRRTSVLATTASVILLKQKKNNNFHSEPVYQVGVCICIFYCYLKIFCLHLHESLFVCLCVWGHIFPTYVELFTVEPHRWMMRSYIPCSHRAARNTIIVSASARLLYCSSLSLCRHFTGEGEIAWRVQITQEGRRKKTVSGHLTAETALHSLTNTLGA